MQGAGWSWAATRASHVKAQVHSKWECPLSRHTECRPRTRTWTSAARCPTAGYRLSQAEEEADASADNAGRPVSPGSTYFRVDALTGTLRRLRELDYESDNCTC